MRKGFFRLDMCRRAFHALGAFVVVGLVGGWQALPASTALSSIDTVANPPVEVSVESFLDRTPPSGFAPILITLRNQTDRVQTFRLAYDVGSRGNSDGYSSDGSAVIEVGARGRSQTYVYVPVLSRTGYSRVQVKLSGPGIRNNSAELDANSSHDGMAFTGMGDRSYVVYWNAIEKTLREQANAASSGYSRGLELRGSRITPASAPADWRAYTGFTSIWLSMPEWSDMDPGARTAIAEWIGLGGNLYLLAKDATQRAAVQIPGASKIDDDDTQYLGLGKITFMSDENQEAFIKKFIKIWEKETVLVDLLQDRGVYRYGSGSSTKGNYSTNDWGLAKIVGKLEAKIGILSLFMILFVIVIGPINFFVLAPSRRRYRILWTTPLIAFAASVILAGVILLSDGTGGSGARLTLGCLLPEQKRILVKQEQVSRTGLLLGDSFNFEAEAQLMPVQMNGSRNSGHLGQTSTGWTGDWYFSRALQAQYACTVRTARGGIHVTLPTDSSEGNVMIALDTPFSEIYIVSADGESVYKATDLLPGVKRPLTAVTKADYDDWWKEAGSEAGTVLKMDMETCAARPGWFYAKAAKPGEIALATLPTIQWTNDTALITGPVVFEHKR